MESSSKISAGVKRYWIYITLGIFAVNSLFLDIYLLFFQKPLQTQTVISKNADLSKTSQNFCPQNCVEKINLALSSQKTSASSAIQPTADLSPTPSATSTPTPTQINSTVKEFFVPLGTGSGKAGDWTVIDGMGAKIDPSDYGNIKTVTFEVTARIPTGNQTIWIRLYNANTSQAVAGSEVTLSGGTVTLLTSSPIILTSGNNFYQIQMKTQLQYLTHIDMARLRIKTN